MDKLQRCAIAFSKLLNVKYNIIIGRKGHLVDIALGFNKTEFVHLMGLHKLKDNEFFRTGTREKVFDSVLEGKVLYEKISKSAYFEFVRSRVEVFEFLESMLDDNNIIFGYNRKKNIYSLIQADFLIQSQYNRKDIYIFLDKLNDSDIYFCRSFFPKNNKDYTVGQAKYQLLYKEKVFIDSGKVIVQYDKLSR